MACSVEIWEMVGDDRTVYTPACLACGWIGGDGSMPDAEQEGRYHEEGSRMPWQFEPGTAPQAWSPRPHADDH